MPETADTLRQKLERGALPSPCLIAGEEPLVQRDTADAWRAVAREQGYTEREVFDVDSGFEWGELEQAAASMSLFGDRRLLELRMPNGKPGKEGAAALAAFAEAAPEDTVLLITCERLERSARESAWTRAIASAGTFVYCWPLPSGRFAEWIAQRMHEAGLRPAEGAVERIAEHVEGNLLAADQAVEKLRLLFGDNAAIQPEQADEALADSARFAADDLCDAALRGDPARAHRILEALRLEGVQPPLVLWAVTRDVRAAARLAGGESERCLQEERIWKNRVGLLKAAARRGSARYWQRLLGRCHQVDRASKGLWPQRPWDELKVLLGLLAKPPGGRALSRPAGRLR